MDIYEVMAVSMMTELVTKIVEEKGGFREIVTGRICG